VSRSSKRREILALIAEALIVVLLVGGLPMFEGVIIAANDGAPSLTLNICHPLPGLNQGSGFSAVPLTSGPPPFEKPAMRGVAGEPPTPSLIRASERPDTPPPKTLS
jgi:hypothetical protein